MKRIVFLAALLLMAVSAQAQIVSSSSRRIVDRPVGNRYIKAGAAFQHASFKYNWGGTSPNLSLGYNVLFGVQNPIDGNGLFWGLEAGVGTRGCNDGNASVLHHGIKVSPNIGYKFELDSDLAVDLRLGAFVSFDFAGGAERLLITEGHEWLFDYDLYNINANLFDLGVIPGITLWYQRFGLDFSYQQGFINLLEKSKRIEYDTNGYTFPYIAEGGPASSFNLSLLYRF